MIIDDKLYEDMKHVIYMAKGYLTSDVNMERKKGDSQDHLAGAEYTLDRLTEVTDKLDKEGN